MQCARNKMFFTSIEHLKKLVLSLLVAQYKYLACLAISVSSHKSLLILTPRYTTSSYVYGVFGAQRSRDCTVTVLVSQVKRGHVTAL